MQQVITGENANRLRPPHMAVAAEEDLYGHQDTNTQTYEDGWRDLNARLRAIEQSGELGAVFAALEDHHRDSSFIKMDLDHVERFTFRRDDRPADYFRIQFNPKRALRFKGAGLSVLPGGAESVHGGCFLCRENIEWQQQGRELGYEIPVGNRMYYTWPNPFPLLPNHVTVARRRHVSQDWRFVEAQEPDGRSVVDDLLTIASQAPGLIGFYNGVDAGASNPHHFHFQFCARPADAPAFPLEEMVGRFCAGEGENLVTDRYPFPVAVWRGAPEDIGTRASSWLRDWIQRNRSRLHELSGNFVVTNEGGGAPLTLYFVPRDREKVRGTVFSGLIGGLEILGELVMSTEKDKEYIDDKRITFTTIEQSLARVHTPVYAE